MSDENRKPNRRRYNLRKLPLRQEQEELPKTSSISNSPGPVNTITAVSAQMKEPMPKEQLDKASQTDKRDPKTEVQDYLNSYSIRDACSLFVEYMKQRNERLPTERLSNSPEAQKIVKEMLTVMKIKSGCTFKIVPVRPSAVASEVNESVAGESVVDGMNGSEIDESNRSSALTNTTSFVSEASSDPSYNPPSTKDEESTKRSSQLTSNDSVNRSSIPTSNEETSPMHTKTSSNILNKSFDMGNLNFEEEEEGKMKESTRSSVLSVSSNLCDGIEERENETDEDSRSYSEPFSTDDSDSETSEKQTYHEENHYRDAEEYFEELDQNSEFAEKSNEKENSETYDDQDGEENENSNLGETVYPAKEADMPEDASSRESTCPPPSNMVPMPKMILFGADTSRMSLPRNPSPIPSSARQSTSPKSLASILCSANKSRVSRPSFARHSATPLGNNMGPPIRSVSNISHQPSECTTRRCSISSMDLARHIMKTTEPAFKTPVKPADDSVICLGTPHKPTPPLVCLDDSTDAVRSEIVENDDKINSVRMSLRNTPRRSILPRSTTPEFVVQRSRLRRTGNSAVEADINRDKRRSDVRG